VRPSYRIAVYIGLFVVAPAVTLSLLPSTSPKGEPLLSGPPQLVVLSLLTALALYLREVNLNVTGMECGEI